MNGKSLLVFFGFFLPQFLFSQSDTIARREWKQSLEISFGKVTSDDFSSAKSFGVNLEYSLSRKGKRNYSYSNITCQYFFANYRDGIYPTQTLEDTLYKAINSQQGFTVLKTRSFRLNKKKVNAVYFETGISVGVLLLKKLRINYYSLEEDFLFKNSSKWTYQLDLLPGIYLGLKFNLPTKTNYGMYLKPYVQVNVNTFSLDFTSTYCLGFGIVKKI